MDPGSGRRAGRRPRRSHRQFCGVNSAAPILRSGERQRVAHWPKALVRVAGIAKSGMTAGPGLLAERESEQARAQQHEAGRGQREESVGDQIVIAHVTPAM